MMTKKLTKKHKKASLELVPVFSLSTVGYCRKMAVQHGGLSEIGPAPYVDRKS